MEKIALVAICIVMVGMLTKSAKEEYYFMIGMAGCILVAIFVIGKIENVLQVVGEINKMIQLGDVYIKLLLKMIGICYLTEFSQEICKDAGYGAVANQIGMAGKMTLLVLGLPVVRSLFACIQGMGK